MIEKLDNHIKRHNISVTDNRRKILLCLIDGMHFHSINDIIEHNKGMNIKSIYNTISIFLQKGVVDSYTFSGITKYAMPDSFFDHGHNSIHLVNKNDHVEHLDIDENIFKEIKKTARSKGKLVKSIKIFVHIE